MRQPSRCPVAVVLCVIFLCVGTSALADQTAHDPVLATVNGQPILRSEFHTRLVRHFGPFLRDRFIIFEKLVELAMRQQNLSVSEGAIDARLRELSEQSLHEEGKTLQDQLAERIGDPALLRHLVRLELALVRMVREKYDIKPDQMVQNKDIVLWFRSTRLLFPTQTHAKYLPEGILVRVGQEYVPTSHVVDLIYLAFPRTRLEDLLQEMAIEKLVEQWAAEAGITVSQRAARARAAPIREQEPLLERISLDEILRLAQSSQEAMEDRARRELLLEALVAQTLTEQDLREEFERHRDWYLGRNVRIRQIFLSAVDPTTGQLRNETQRARALELLRAIRREIETGGDFEKLALVYGEDASALRGGDIGWFPQPGVLGDALNNAALALDRRTLDGPLESALGFHLIEATEARRRSGGKFTDSSVQERLKTNLVRLRLPEWWTEHFRAANIQLFPDRLK